MATERFHPLFADDLRAACEYYDSISSDVGTRFRNRARMRLLDINSRPESFGRIGGDYRGAMRSGFPYVIVFTVDQDGIAFFGHSACSVRPEWWVFSFDAEMTAAANHRMQRSGGGQCFGNGKSLSAAR